MSTEADFAVAYGLLDEMCGWLAGDGAALTHGELEDELDVRGRELLRTLFQEHLDRLAGLEERVEVTDASGVARRSVEAGHCRALTTVFGEVTVTRCAYRQRGHANLHPVDARLNLPPEKHSHGVRRWAGLEAARGSFDSAADAIWRGCGQPVGKRQLEQLAAVAAVDFDGFYQQRPAVPADPGDVLVLTVDGKGIVMRPDALRRHAPAPDSAAKHSARLSNKEKRNRKRMATVAAVYDAAPVPRTPGQVIRRPDDTGPDRTTAADGPTAANKWLHASIVNDPATVIAAMFDEATRRDPAHQRTWVALVDGNNHQIDCLFSEAARRGVDLTVVCDFVHVPEYLWRAAWCFYDDTDPDAEAWVSENATKILQGHATTVAAAIRRKATYHKLSRWQRQDADRAAAYLANKAHLLDYPTALTAGWPIATGVIEGACRHLVKDRMDITGARWGLDGAEAVLKLRALRCNHDFDDYWQFHLTQEHQRVHQNRYANNETPTAA